MYDFAGWKRGPFHVVDNYIDENTAYGLCVKIVPYAGGKAGAEIYPEVSILSAVERVSFVAFVLCGVGFIFLLLS